MMPLLMLAILVLFTSSFLYADEPLQIRLYESAQVQNPLIHLRTVAEIQSRDQALVRRLGDIDLLQLDSSSTSSTLTREQVYIRLALAGVHPEEITLIGAGSVSIDLQTPRPWTDERFLSELSEIVATRLGIEQQQLQLELSSFVISSLSPSLTQSSEFRCEPVLPHRVSLGTLPVTARLWAGERSVGSRTIQVTIRRKMPVPVTTRAISRLEQLRHGDVALEQRFVDRELPQLPVEDHLGKRPLRDLKAGEHIESQMLVTPVSATQRTAVRPGDTVSVVIQRGSVRVTLQTAEALQAGNPGDIIRVKNTNTNSVIKGMIREDGRVEILTR